MAQAEFSYAAILADLQLRNFRCFEGLALQFEPGFSFFVGPNGEGKTSLMEGACVRLVDCDGAGQMYPIARAPAVASQKLVTATCLDWREDDDEGPIFELRDGNVRPK